MTLKTDAGVSVDSQRFTIDGQPVNGQYPLLKFAIAPDIGVYDERIVTSAGIWTDITNWVHAPTGCAITRGRSNEFDSPQASECTFTIRDTDRTFDPLNSGSPFARKLRPRMPVKISATWSAVEYPLFVGYIEGWPQKYVLGDNVTFIDIIAHDILSVLNGQRFQPARPAILDDNDFGILDSYIRLAGQDPLLPSGRTGDRISDLLLAVGLGGALTEIDTGQTVVVASIPSEDNMLSHMETVTRTELGRLWVTPSGTLRWQERTYVDETPAALFIDYGTGLPYSELELDPLALQDIKNEITRGNGHFDPVTAKDSTSVDLYGTLSDERTDLLFDSVYDAAAQVTYLLTRFATPQTRVRTLTTLPVRSPDLMWPAILAWDLGTRLVVGRTPQRIGTPYAQTVSIERIEHHFTSSSWSVTFGLAQPDLHSYARCDSSTTGVLDSDFIVAY